MLQALDQVENDHRHPAEEKHRDRILRPAHLVPFVHTGHAIQQSLERTQQRVEKRFPPVENPSHERAHRFRQRKDDEQEQPDLKPAICTHGLKFLRPQQRSHQVREQQHTNPQQNYITDHLSYSLLQSITAPHIHDRHGKKTDGAHYEYKVPH